MPEPYTKPSSTPYFFPKLPHCCHLGRCCFNCVVPRAALNNGVHKNAMRTPTTVFTGTSFTASSNINAIFLSLMGMHEEDWRRRANEQAPVKSLLL